MAKIHYRNLSEYIEWFEISYISLVEKLYFINILIINFNFEMSNYGQPYIPSDIL